MEARPYPLDTTDDTYDQPPLTDVDAARAELDRRMLETCTAMKREGIRIYSITFQLPEDATGDVFRACATNPAHHFSAPSTDALHSSFTQIATALATPRREE